MITGYVYLWVVFQLPEGQAQRGLASNRSCLGQLPLEDGESSEAASTHAVPTAALSLSHPHCHYPSLSHSPWLPLSLPLSKSLLISWPLSPPPSTLRSVSRTVFSSLASFQFSPSLPISPSFSRPCLFLSCPCWLLSHSLSLQHTHPNP